MLNDPWEDMQTPTANFMVKRVDSKARRQFHWAKGTDGKCALIFNHKSNGGSSAKLPQSKGINVEIFENTSEDSTLLVRLLESDDRAIFYKLCTDIVEAGQLGLNDDEALSNAISQTWRWHHLLRGGSSKLLSVEEQKGLIGEILVLREILIPQLGARDSIKSWTGPGGAPKDFEIGNKCIESKARRSAATPFVSISSEFQLDDSSVEELFLHVCEINNAPPGTSGGFNITTIAAGIRDILDEDDPNSALEFESLLNQRGFDFGQDYSKNIFVEGDHSIYEVKGNFPRITASDMRSGVARVVYTVSLQQCEPYHITKTELLKAFERGR